MFHFNRFFQLLSSDHYLRITHKRIIIFICSVFIVNRSICIYIFFLSFCYSLYHPTLAKILSVLFFHISLSVHRFLSVLLFYLSSGGQCIYIYFFFFFRSVILCIIRWSIKIYLFCSSIYRSAFIVFFPFCRSIYRLEVNVYIYIFFFSFLLLFSVPSDGR